MCNDFTYSIWCVCFFKVNDERWANLMSGKDYGELMEHETENCLEGGETKPFFLILILGFHGVNKIIYSNNSALGPIKTCRYLSDSLLWPRNIF